MGHISLLLLAVAISLDGLGTGFAYGLRKMKLPFRSILIITLCTAFSLGFAMLFGQFIQSFLPPQVAGRLGGMILIIIGSWIIFQFFKPESEQSGSQEKFELKWEIQSLGIVIHILKKPTRADFDRSGTITGLEAIMLGAALSLDAFGVGIGAAMLGFHPFLLAGAAALSGILFLSCGLALGKFFSHIKAMQKIAFFPGVLLILIGFFKM